MPILDMTLIGASRENTRFNKITANNFEAASVTKTPTCSEGDEK